MADNPCLHHTGIVEQLKAICSKIELIEKMNEKAVETARHDMERRLESMNEFRDQLSKQANEFITRKEIELLWSKSDITFNELRKKIETLEDFQSERKGSLRWSDYSITAIISAIIFILAHFLFKL